MSFFEFLGVTGRHKIAETHRSGSSRTPWMLIYLLIPPLAALTDK
nr:MAG TPA: hypothetical protein [Inoviridae sp.]